MVSSDGRSVVILNGEIYNFQELGRELEAQGVVFRSKSDTEVLLEGLNRWGVDWIARLNGMFAFAWYRVPERTLVAAGITRGSSRSTTSARPMARGSRSGRSTTCSCGRPGEARARCGSTCSGSTSGSITSRRLTVCSRARTSFRPATG